MNDNIEIDGSMLKALREIKKMTQEDVGKIIGVTKQNINKIEQKKILTMSIDNLKALADYFQVTVAFFCPSDFPISNLEMYEDNYEIAHFIERLFYDSSTLRATDLRFLEEIMQRLQFDEKDINDTIQAIQRSHESKQTQIRSFIQRIFDKDSNYRKSDCYALKSILEKIKLDKLNREKESIEEAINKIEDENERKKNDKKKTRDSLKK